MTNRIRLCQYGLGGCSRQVAASGEDPMSAALVEREIQALVGYGVANGIVPREQADEWVATLWEANCMAIRERYREQAEAMFPQLRCGPPRYLAIGSKEHLNVVGDSYWYQVSQQAGWEGSVAEARTAAILYAIAASGEGA